MEPDALRRLRDNLGYTQARLAAILGVHPLTVSRWECGTLAPTPVGLRLLHAIQSALSLEPVQLPVRLASIGADPIRELTAIFVVLHPDLARVVKPLRARSLRGQIRASGGLDEDFGFDDPEVDGSGGLGEAG